MKKRLLFIIMGLVLVFAMAACTINKPEEGPQAEEITPDIEEPVVEIPEEPIIEDEDDKVSYEEIVLTPMEAYDLFLDLYPEMQVTEIELDKYFGSYVYKIKGYKDNEKIKVKLNPINGDIIDTDSEIEDDLKRDKEITSANVEKIQALLDKALLDAGAGASVDEWSLEWEDEILELEVEIDLMDSRDIDYTYNIESGELIKKDE